MGRPRSVQAHDQVLEAAAKLFASNGIDATSMDAIANESGVSKATIYRHWPDKSALCLEVMSRVHGLDQRPELSSQNTRDNLVTLLAYRADRPHSEMQERMMPHLLAYAARDLEFAKSWRKRVMEPPRAQIKEVLRKAIGKRELPPDLDVDFAAALLVGPMLYRYFLTVVGAPLPENMPQRIVDAFWKAHAVKEASRGA
jgi:AcrR family transcriptional regulator